MFYVGFSLHYKESMFQDGVAGVFSLWGHSFANESALRQASACRFLT